MRMSYQLEQFLSGLLAVVITIVLVGGLLFGLCALRKAQCNSQTENIGFNHKWQFLSGCMIETKPNIWIPLDNWRALND